MACTYYAHLSVSHIWRRREGLIGEPYVGLIGGEAVVDSGRKNEQIILVQLHTHPLVILAPDIKVTLAASDVTDFLILVQVLVEEHLNLVLVYVSHFLRRHKDLVAVFIPSFSSELVHVLKIRKAIVDDS